MYPLRARGPLCCDDVHYTRPWIHPFFFNNTTKIRIFLFFFCCEWVLFSDHNQNVTFRNTADRQKRPLERLVQHEAKTRRQVVIFHNTILSLNAAKHSVILIRCIAQAGFGGLLWRCSRVNLPLYAEDPSNIICVWCISGCEDTELLRSLCREVHQSECNKVCQMCVFWLPSPLLRCP